MQSWMVAEVFVSSIGMCGFIYNKQARLRTLLIIIIYVYFSQSIFEY